jgi:putative endonuclease
MMTQMNTKDKGHIGETLAERFLQKNKVKIIMRNFRSRFGEIDIIGLKKNSLVFYEVKYREHTDFCPIEYAVDRKKVDRIVRSSRMFLMQNPSYGKKDLEYQAILITKKDEKHNIEVIKNLIQPDNIINGFL